jgi:putative FmdB family regulatory protein
MPLYDYQCSDCGETYDVFHKVREVAEDVVCPSCNSVNHVRLVSAPAFTMRGSRGSSSDPAPSCTDGACCAGSCGVNG